MHKTQDPPQRLAREIALQILFQLEFQKEISIEKSIGILSEALPIGERSLAYARQLIDGVRSFQSEIDSVIQKVSPHWKLTRMASIDRNILRIGVLEMQFLTPQLKGEIAINEAVDLAKKFSTQESGAFVNGLLDEVRKGS